MRKAASFAALAAALIAVITAALAIGAPPRDAGDPYGLAREPEVQRALREQHGQAERRRTFRASPEGRKAREQSRTAHQGASRHEALVLAQQRFGEVLDAPPIHGLPIHAGEHLDHYVGDSAAVVRSDDDKHGALAVSSFPLRTEKDGALEPTDLRLAETSDGGFETRNSPLPVKIAADLSGGVRMPGLVTIDPVLAASAPAGELVGGKVFFASVAADTDMLVAAQPGGAEIYTQIRSPEAPDVQAYDVHMPDGATLRMSSDVPNTAEVVRGGDVLATIAPPTAFDADGESVPMSYRVDGSRLFVKVAHRDGDFRYPILADPLVADNTFNSPPPSGQPLPDEVNGWGRKINPSNGPPWGFDYRDGSPFGRASWGTGLWIWDWPGGTYATGNSGEWLFEWNKGANDTPSTGNSSFIARLVASGGDFDPRVISGQSYTCLFFGMWSDKRANWDKYQFACGANTRNYSPDVYPSVNPTDYNVGTPGNHATMAIWTSANSSAGSQTVAQVDRMIVYLSDQENPTISSVAQTVPTSQWGDNEPRSVTVAAADGGLGVKQVQLKVPSTSGGATVDQGCTGLKGSLCPSSWTTPSAIPYSYSGLPEGTSQTGSVQAFDAAQKGSALSTWGLKVDHTAGSIDAPTGAAGTDGAWVKEGPQAMTVTSRDGLSGVEKSQISIAASLQARDRYQRTVTNGWGTPFLGGPWTVLTGSASSFSANGSEGSVNTPTNSPQAIGLTDQTDLNSDTSVDVRFPSALQASGDIRAELLPRKSSTSTYRVILWRDAAGKIWLRIDGNTAAIGPSIDTGMVDTPGATYRLRGRVSGTNPTTLKAKVWRVGSPEPGAWASTVTDSTLGPQVAGDPALRVFQTTPANTTVVFDNYLYSDLDPHVYSTATNKKADGTAGPCTKDGCWPTLDHSYPWDTTDEVEGPHTVTVHSNDPLGHAPADRTWTVNVDTQAPVRTAGPSGTLWSNNGKFIRQGTYDLSATATDPGNGSGIEDIQVLVNGTEDDPTHAAQNCSPACPQTATRTYTFNTANRTEGAYHVEMIAHDKARHATTIATVDVKLDTNNPSNGTNTASGDLAPPPGNRLWVGPGSRTLTRTPTDSYSGVMRDYSGVSHSLVVDPFTRTTASDWGSTTSGGAWQTGWSSGTASTNGGEGVLTASQNGTSSQYLPASTARDTDQRAFFRFPNFTPNGAAGDNIAAGIISRLTTCAGGGSEGCNNRVMAVVEGNGKMLLRVRMEGSSAVTLPDVDTGLTYTPGAYYWLRVMTLGTSPTTIMAGLYKNGDPWPGWMLRATGNEMSGPVAEGAGASGLKMTSWLPGTASAAFDTFTVEDFTPETSYRPACDASSGCATTAPAQTLTWDTNAATELPHTAFALTTDAVHHTSVRDWEVDVDKTAPAITNKTGSLSQANGAIGLGSQTLSVDVGDSGSGVHVGSGVKKIEFLINGNPLQQVDGTCGSIECNTTKHADFTWDSSDSQGRVTVGVRMTDNVGNTRTDSWTVAVDSDNPTIVSTTGNLAPIAGRVPWVAEDTGTLTVNSHDAESGMQKSEITLTPNAIGGDEFSRSTSNGWGSAPRGGAWTVAQGVASSFSTDGSRGLINVPSSPQAMKLGSLIARDADARVDISFPAPVAASGEEIGYVLLRRTGGHSYTIGLVRTSLGRILIRSLDGSGAVVAPDVDTGMSDLAGGTQFRFRLRVTGTAPTSVRAKAWKVGDREPAAWNLDINDGSVGPQTSGELLLQGVETTPKPSSTIAFDNYAASDLGGGLRNQKLGLNSSGAACNAADCPNDLSQTWNWASDHDVEGLHSVFAKVYDAAAHTAQTPSWDIGVDRTPPLVTLSGSLKNSEGKTLYDGQYQLHVDAKDGDAAARETQNSGVKTIKIQVDGVAGTVTGLDDAQDCATGNCGMQRDWTFRPADWTPGPYTIRVTSTDQVAVGAAEASHTTVQSFNVIVSSIPIGTPDKLGLEDYFQYRSVPTGGQTSAHVNLANGNLVWHSMPVVNPGRGLSSFVNLTYNSQSRLEDGGELEAPLRYKQAGLGFSLGISGITRVNEPLDVSLASAGVITLTDPDGTRHRFRSHDLDESYDPPPGVQLYLRRFSTSVGPTPPFILGDPAKTWAATRPDGVTYYFDAGGWPTTIEDRNGNKLTFNYECIDPTSGAIQAVCDLEGTVDMAGNPIQLRRLKSVTDAAATGPDDASRSVSFGYDTNNIANNEIVGHVLTGHVHTITDHAGRVTTLGYDGDYLTSMTQATGTADERTFGFGYEPEQLAHALDERYMTSVTDPRGASTTFRYEDKDLVQTNPRRALDVYDRRSPSGDTHFEYTGNGGTCDATTCTDVTDPLGRVTNNKLDDRARLVQTTNARGARTNILWDDESTDDNNVAQITEVANDPSQTAVRNMTYDSNGLLLTSDDPDHHCTALEYQEGAGTQRSQRLTTSDNGKTFVADLVSITTPMGTGDDCASWSPSSTAYKTRFTLDSEGKGNVLHQTNPLGDVADTDYVRNADGTIANGNIASETDWHAPGATALNTTTYSSHDANGNPKVMIDARGNETGATANDHRWILKHDVVGNLVKLTDPRGAKTGGPDDPRSDFTTTLDYDNLDRVTAVTRPRDTANNDFVTSKTHYDTNGNVDWTEDAEHARTHKYYTPMDELERVESPPVVHEVGTVAAPEVTRMSYDAAGNLTDRFAPRNVEKGGNSYSTHYEYDVTDGLVAEIKRSRNDSPHPDEDIATSYDRDLRGNVIGLSDPAHNAAAGADPADNAKVPARRRFTYTYDRANNRLTSLEDPGGFAYLTKYTYDANDNLRTVVDPRGTTDPAHASDYTTTFDYDTADRKIDVVDPNGDRTDWNLRPDGRPRAITKPNGTRSCDGRTSLACDYQTKYDYYATGDLKSFTLPRAPQQYGPATQTFSYDRDPAGNPQHITDGRGKTFDNTFWDTGELKSTTRPSFWHVERISQDDGGLQVSEPSPDDLMGQQDDSGRDGMKQPQNDGDFGPTKQQDLPDLLPKAGSTDFGYDNDMRLTSVTDTPAPGTTIHPVAKVSYDAVGRTRTVTQPLDATAGSDIVNEFRYDLNGNLAAQIDGENATTGFVYDQFDRKTRTDLPPDSAGASPDPRSQRVKYDENDNRLTVTSPRGNVTTYAYDAVDRLRSQDDPLHHLTTFDSYDAADNLLTTTSPKGNARGSGDPPVAQFQTKMTYDGANRMVTRKDGFGNVTTYGYDHDGNQTSLTEPGALASSGGATVAQVTERRYDGRDLPWTEQHGTGSDARATVTEFDGNGNLRRQVNPEGVNTSSTLPQPKLPDNAPQNTLPSNTSDQSNAALKNATKNATVYEYSAENVMNAMHLPWGPKNLSDSSVGDDNRRFRQDFGIDARGRAGAITAPYEWTVAGAPRPIQETFSFFDTDWIKVAVQHPTSSAKNTKFEYGYDKQGHQTHWCTESAGDNGCPDSSTLRKIDRSYFPGGEMKHRDATVPSDSSQNRAYDYTYDLDGQLKTVHADNPDRTQTLTYDDAGRNQAIQVTGGPSKDTQFDYDANDNVLQRRTDGTIGAGGGYSGGKTTSFTYDPLDHETTMEVTSSGEATRSSRTTYYDSGQRKKRTLFNGAVDSTVRVGNEFFYGSDGRMVHKDRTPASGTADHQDYNYDSNANRTKDDRGTSRFNARNQLISWDPSAPNKPSITYTMNGSGSIQTETKNSVTTTFYYVDNSDRLDRTVTEGQSQPTYYCYTDAGEVKRISSAQCDQPTPADAITYEYDGFSRMIKSHGDGTQPDASYSYDGLDRREVRCTNSASTPAAVEACSGGKRTEFSYIGLTDTLSKEQDRDSSGATGEERSYDYDSSGERIGMDKKGTPTSAGTYKSYKTDPTGSVVGLEDDNGAVATNDQYNYDPYGQEDKTEEANLSADAKDNPFRFEGFYYDSGVKTYDMQARQYSPEVGRFLTEDRLESSSDDFNLEADPLTQDRYGFAGGNPINNIEFDGHEPASSFTNGCDPMYGSDRACRHENRATQRRSRQNQRHYSYAYSSNWRVGRRTSPSEDRGNAASASDGPRYQSVAHGYHPHRDPKTMEGGNYESPLPTPGPNEIGLAARMEDVYLSEHNEDVWTDLLWVTDPVAGGLRSVGRAAVDEGIDKATPFARRLFSHGGEEEAKDRLAQILGAAERVGVRPEEGFSSFGRLKTALGKGREGYDYHHIVEQSNVKHGTLPAELVQNPKNIVEIERGVHRKISAYYSRKPEFTGGLTVREWVRQMPYDEQYRYGQEIIRRAENGELP